MTFPCSVPQLPALRKAANKDSIAASVEGILSIWEYGRLGWNIKVSIKICGVSKYHSCQYYIHSLIITIRVSLSQSNQRIQCWYLKYISLYTVVTVFYIQRLYSRSTDNIYHWPWTVMDLMSSSKNQPTLLMKLVAWWVPNVAGSSPRSVHNLSCLANGPSVLVKDVISDYHGGMSQYSHYSYIFVHLVQKRTVKDQ